MKWCDVRQFVYGMLMVITFWSIGGFSAELTGINYRPYSANMDGHNLYVRTPAGTLVYIGDNEFHKAEDFVVDIPLKDVLNLQAQQTQNQGFGGGVSGVDAANGIGKSKTSTGAESKDPRSYLDVSSLVTDANRLFQKGNFTKSLDLVNEILKRETDSVRGWTMKGSLMHVLGFKELAHAAWKEALRLDPKNKELQKIVGGIQ